MAPLAQWTQTFRYALLSSVDHGRGWRTPEARVGRGQRRALLATLIFAGLRVGEALALRCSSPTAPRGRRGDRPTWGEVIAGPLYNEEGIVIADCDLRRGLHAMRWFDAVGHYSREDVLSRDPAVGAESIATDLDGVADVPQ